MAAKQKAAKSRKKKSGYVRSHVRFDSAQEVFEALRTHPMINIKGRNAPFTLRETVFFAGVLTKHLMDAILNGASIKIEWPDRKVEVIDIDFTFEHHKEDESA